MLITGIRLAFPNERSIRLAFMLAVINISLVLTWIESLFEQGSVSVGRRARLETERRSKGEEGNAFLETGLATRLSAAVTLQFITAICCGFKYRRGLSTQVSQNAIFLAASCRIPQKREWAVEFHRKNTAIINSVLNIKHFVLRQFWKD